MDALTCCGHIFWTPGNGRLNYITGYVSKNHDAVEVLLSEVLPSEVPLPEVLLSEVLLSEMLLPEVPLSEVLLSEVPLPEVPLPEVLAEQKMSTLVRQGQ